MKTILLSICTLRFMIAITVSPHSSDDKKVLESIYYDKQHHDDISRYITNKLLEKKISSQ